MSGNPIQFQFVAQKYSDETFHVLSFTATESISKTYQWEIDLISNDPALDPAEIVNFGASFRFSVVIDRFPIHGIVTRFVQLGRTHIAENSKDHSYLYRAVLEPTLSRLALPMRSETFVQQSLPVLLKEILTRNRIEGEQVRYELKEDNYSEQWQTTQFEESDLHFLQRLCESEGIFYRFEQGEEEAVLVLDDTSESSPELARTPTLSFQDKSFIAEGAERTDLGKTVSTFSFSRENIPEKVQLSEYNWMHPGQRLKKTVPVTDAGGYGTFQDHRSHFFTEKGADFFARIRKEEILCRQNLFRGTSTAFTMRAGMTFTLTDHFNQNLNTEYLVTEVHHKGSQGIYFSPEDFQYENNFTAIRADIPFRPQRVTPVPRIEGVIHAHVDSSTGDTYADINEDGMYRVRFPFDITEGDKGNSKASRFVRMAQSYAGSGMGMHFPLHKGTEVVIAFTGGDPDRPVIIGAVPNKETASPVTSKNNTQSRIETPGGNTMIFEDQEGVQTIHMAVNKEGQQAFVRIGTLMPKPE